MAYFLCECGEKFPEDQEGAREHVLEQHLDLVETRFEEFFDEVEDYSAQGDSRFEDLTIEEIYDEAVDDVTDELLDAIEE